jgi:Rad52/22 family double-strand break repair protein
MSLSPKQYELLLAPLDENRVEARDGMSYLNVSDVRRWLIRIFGFGGFSYTSSEAELVSHLEVPQRNKPDKINQVVSWKVKGTLYIPCLDATYEGYAIGTSNQPVLGDAHDMAIKTAESDALKRCAMNLGDAFGLSLYFSKGQRVVYQSVFQTLAPVIVTGERQPSPTPALPAAEDDVVAVPEGTTNDDGSSESAHDAGQGSAETAAPGLDPSSDPVTEAALDTLNDAGLVALPDDFWDQMAAIKKTKVQTKRLRASVEYRTALDAMGIRSDLAITAPSGAQLTVGRAFDIAIEGEPT